MKIGKVKRIAPDAVASDHAVAAVGDDQAREEIVFLLHGEIEAAAVIGTDNGLQEGIPFGDGLWIFPLTRKGLNPAAVMISRGTKEQMYPITFFPSLWSLLCPESIILIISFDRSKMLFSVPPIDRLLFPKVPEALFSFDTSNVLRRRSVQSQNALPR